MRDAPKRFNPTDRQWNHMLSALSAMPPAEIEARLHAEQTESDTLYAEFRASMKAEKCSSCGKPLATFSPGMSCFHWLLRPKGVKKDHIGELLGEKGYFRTAAYVRWVANYAAQMAKINDLASEGTQDAIFHWSATYKHIKWTFICTRADLNGHGGTSSDFPHFHFEMRLSGQSFIKFNDFHVPLNEEDQFKIRSNLDPQCRVKHGFGFHGAGIQDAFSIPPEDVLEHSVPTDDANAATYHIQTMVIDPNGISGERLSEIIKSATASGKSIANEIRKSGLPSHIVISPVDELPTKEERNNPRK